MPKKTLKPIVDILPEPQNHQTISPKVIAYSLLTEFDIALFQAGKHFKLYEKMGSHTMQVNNLWGVYFAVWAPNAHRVELIGNFNHWNGFEHALYPRHDGSGIWEGFIPHIGKGETYKYKIFSKHYGQILEKADPFANYCEVPPQTASVVWDLNHDWSDDQWLKKRKHFTALDRPCSVYEVHLGSWKRHVEDANRSLTYTELAADLVRYVKDMNYTHVEFLPIMQHPFSGSWGYQLTGYFSCASAYGNPQELMYLIQCFHQQDIGVILDWVPSHFPGDGFGLINFDGTHLYEHADPRQGYHPDWSSYIFNYGRNEVRSFLGSSAGFWLDRYHIDGLRVDAVASMLYLDYSRKEGEWIPNQYGGKENLHAISLLQDVNEYVYQNFDAIQMIAEESTSFHGVSKPVFAGGLGFGMKWMMGWMNDTLKYFARDPMYRRWHQDQLSFSLVYAFSENFMLPISHDEVVYGKGSLLDKMPGDDWQRFANLRLLFTYMFTHPGTKLLFMGSEFGQLREWNFEQSLDWHLLADHKHKGAQTCLKQLNVLLKSEPALHEYNFSPEGFEWIDAGDRENCVLAYARKGMNPSDQLVIVLNMTPTPRANYRIGVPTAGNWTELFNSDTTDFFGSGLMNNNVHTEAIAWHGRSQSVQLTLPPLGGIVLKNSGK